MQLREELEEMKDMASKLDAKLKESEEHCEVYKLQYKTQIEKEDEILKWDQFFVLSALFCLTFGSQCIIRMRENRELASC